MKDLLQLYFTFFKIGIVSFGGGYAMLPLLERELVEKRGWVTSDEIADYYAIGQCTPGAIAVNVSTFIGYKRKGTLGGIASTLGFVSPAFIIIYLIATILKGFADNVYVGYALSGIRVCVVVLVLQAILKLFKKSIKDKVGLFIAILVGALAIFVKPIPLFVYVIVAGVFGIVYNVIKNKRALKKHEENKEEEQTVASEEVTSNEAIETETKKASRDLSFLWFILGLILGLPFGIIALILYPIIRQKKYLNGVLTAVLFNVIIVVCTLVTVFNQDPSFFRLYFEFFRVGVCAFGGGLATIPFLSELAETTGWFTQLDLANMIAVSESTPGAMGVNMSTYVGYTTAISLPYGNHFLSFVGSVLSTLGLVSPSIIVIEIVCLFLAKFKNNKYVEYAFYGLRAASIGLIIAAFYSILKVSIIDVNRFVGSWDAFKNIPTVDDFFKDIALSIDALVSWKNLAVACVLGFFVFKFKKHPIFYIAIAAILGIVLRMGGIGV